MKVTALGSADAFFSAGRGHTAWLVEDEQGVCSVDFGATALLALKRLGRDPEDLGAIHFTHLHGDHIAGWPFLLVDAVYRKPRKAPLIVSGPSGTRKRLEMLWAACYARAAETPLPFEVTFHELRVGDTVRLGGRMVRAFAAQHMSPPDVALCLRIGELAFTGDTGAIPAGLCDGAKLLCTECTDFSAPSGDPPRHLAWKALAAALPDVPRILVAHLGADAREAIPRDGRVQVCDDLDAIEL